jgi:translation initiation factor 2B subunit (eIF-2B alpha/beta/delta family)
MRYAYPVTRVTGTRQMVSSYPLKTLPLSTVHVSTKSRRNSKDKYYFGETRDVITPYYDKTPVLLFTEFSSQ